MVERIFGLRKKRFWYPTEDFVKQSNQKIINLYKASKAESHKVLSSYKIRESINQAKKRKGDVYIKAASLLRGLNLAHPFASANKRTAYFVANNFIAKNEGYLLAKKRSKQGEFGLKVREGNLTDEQIAKWLRRNKK